MVAQAKIVLSIGERYGRLTVIGTDLRMPPSPSEAARGLPGLRAALCQCECGAITTVRVRDLKKIQSCGCIRIGRKLAPRQAKLAS